MFGTRVKTFQKKLEDHKNTLSSPIPSPDINAPSPNSDSDIDLPEEDQNDIVTQAKGSVCLNYYLHKVNSEINFQKMTTQLRIIPKQSYKCQPGTTTRLYLSKKKMMDS